jgi:IS30 family transposase
MPQANALADLPVGSRSTAAIDSQPAERGKEMASQKSFTIAHQRQVYFCDRRSAWRGGNNENSNGLLRPYFPKGTNLLVLLASAPQPAKPLATRLERKHQAAATPILSSRDELGAAHAGPSQQGGTSAQRAA